MNKNLLISFDEYQKMPPNKVPYTYIISNGKQYLYYFGSKHSYDATLPQFVELKAFFEEFVSKTEAKDRIVLIEGGGIPPIADSEDLAITKYGEMGYVRYLSNKNHIDIYSPEPSRALMYKELLKHFSREEIEYYFFASIVPQWIRMSQKPSFEEYVQGFLERDKKESNWDDFDFSLENMKIIHKKLFNIDFDTSDSQFSKKIVDPTKQFSIINDVVRFVSNYRNEYIVDELERYWNEGKNVFVVYGSTHAVIQEPVLRTLE